MSVFTAPLVGTFCWPELCSADAAASKKFYESLFGWEHEDHHMPEGDYSVFKMEGEGVGAIYEMQPDRKRAGVHPHWNSYVAVADADHIAEQCAFLGGKVLMQPFEAGADRMANLEDPLGARFSIFEASRQTEPIRLNEMGTLCWTELYTTDFDQAVAFYSALFGWRAEPWEGGPMPYVVFHHNEQESRIGGMLEITDEMHATKPMWEPYFQVEDADATAQQAKQMGAKVCKVFDVPKIGRIAQIADPQGAMFAVIHPESQ